MLFVTGFVVYDILFWSFIAILALIVTRDRFARPISDHPTVSPQVAIPDKCPQKLESANGTKPLSVNPVFRSQQA
jgi:hypothetical protein